MPDQPFTVLTFYQRQNHTYHFSFKSLILILRFYMRVFVKRKCEQKGPKKVSTFSTRFHVVSNVFPKYQMLTF